MSRCRGRVGWLLFVGLLLISSSAAGPVAPPRLAVLVAACLPGEAAMHHDLVEIHDALRRRGFQPEQIMCLDGTLSAGLVRSFLREAAGRIASWQRGEVFLFYSGHGSYAEEAGGTLRPALQLAAEPSPERVFWDELFRTLAPPPGVRLFLLPDC